MAKICITSTGVNLESEIDPRFGRCSYFIIVNTETSEFEAIKNGNADSGGGAGIQAGQLICEKGVKALLTGSVGPNAFKTLHAGKVEIITGLSGKVKNAVIKYKNGELVPSENPDAESHAGMKRI